MNRSLPLAALAFVACTNDPAPVTPTPVASASVSASSTPPVASSAAPVAKACLPARAAEGGILHLAVQGKQVLACFLDASLTGGNPYAEPGQSHPCLLVDPETGAVAEAPPYKVPEWTESAPSPTAVTVETTASTVKVCPADKAKCKTITIPGQTQKATKKAEPKPGDKKGKKGKKAVAPPPPDADPPIAAFADDTGGKVFVFVRDKDKKGGFQLQGDTYDVATGKRTARVLLTTYDPSKPDTPMGFADPTNTWRGHFVGNRVALSDTVCCGPGQTNWLVDPVKGQKLFLSGYGGSLAQDPTSKAWLVLHDKILSIVDLDAFTKTPIATAPGDGLDLESISADWISVGGKLVLVHTNKPGLAIVDVAAKKAGPTHALPICAAP